jgi:hypothetical protein
MTVTAMNESSPLARIMGAVGDDKDRQAMVQFMPWPFTNGEFPARLGAVVMKTVLDGSRPALHVAHFPDGSWAIGDGDDPNAPDSCVATHIWHAIERNSSIRELASIPPGHVADREAPGSPWAVHEWVPED